MILFVGRPSGRMIITVSVSKSRGCTRVGKHTNDKRLASISGLDEEGKYGTAYMCLGLVYRIHLQVLPMYRPVFCRKET